MANAFLERIPYILAAILIFGVLIAVHELGHFLAAKLSGVQVNEFSIGMGPTLWHRQKGETQYSLRALPIGGFCAMEGEDEDSENPRALNRQGFWKKFFIFVAGAAMNFLTGFLIILILFSGAESFFLPVLKGTAPEFSQRNETVLQAGDEIWSINGERVYIYGDVSLLLGLSKQQPVDMVVIRDGEKVAVNDISWGTYTSSDGSSYQGYGLFISQSDTVKATVGAKLKYSWLNAVDFVREVRLSLQMLLTGKASMNDVSGPVGIVSTITEVGQQSASVQDAVENILYLAALIAVNLAVMNLLPIPALDGGHILFLVLDELALLLFRRRIPAKYEAALNIVFFVALMGFMAVVTFHDVFKLIQ